MAADLPPLSDEERAEVRRQLDEMRLFTSALPPLGLLSQTIRDMGEVLSRLLAERDALAARVSSLEAEAQEVRRAWDENADHVRLCPGGVGGPCDCWVSTVGTAIDALYPSEVRCASCGLFDAHTIGCVR